MAAEDAAVEPLTRRAAIGIVGAGPVAQALGRRLRERGEPVVALANRNRQHAEHAAAFIGAGIKVVDGRELSRLVSQVLIAVSDSGLEATAAMLADAGMRTGVALHTCGARGPDALEPLRAAGVSCGVLHPLQTIPTPELGVTALDGIAFGVGGDPQAVESAERMVRILGGRSLRIAAGAFPAYHAGAVMASNHLIAVVDAALVLLGQAGISSRDAIDAIGPLCRATLENALHAGPAAALTGPVARGDAGTIAAHLEAMADSSAEVAGLYRAAARHLIALARSRGLAAPDVRRLQSVLDTGNS